VYASSFVNDGVIEGRLVLSANNVVENGVLNGNGTSSFNPGATNTVGVYLGAGGTGAGTLVVSNYVNTVTFASGSNWEVEGGAVYSGIDSENWSGTTTAATEFMNFGTGDTIVIEGAVGTGTLDTGSVSVSSAANWDYVNFVVDFGSSTYAYRVDIQTSITNPNFVVTEDGNGGADITVEEEVTCFLRGTRIRPVFGGWRGFWPTSTGRICARSVSAAAAMGLWWNSRLGRRGGSRWCAPGMALHYALPKTRSRRQLETDAQPSRQVCRVRGSTVGLSPKPFWRCCEGYSI
jgi:hypothetical protein